MTGITAAKETAVLVLQASSCCGRAGQQRGNFCDVKSRFPFAFDAVYYHVTDMEKSIAFYRDILGFRLASQDYVARFDLDGVLFELVPNPPHCVLPGTGNARLSLGVADIRQAKRELNARGIATTPVKEEPGGLLSYFKDPDGNELCLWQNA